MLEVEAALLNVSDARTRVIARRDALRRDDAAPHLIQALDDLAALLDEAVRVTTHRTYFAVPERASSSQLAIEVATP